MSIHRAIEAFAESFEDRTVLGQVLIIRSDPGFQLSHEADAERIGDCENISLEGLREIAQHTLTGAYRPLKAAPSLRSGWSCQVNSPPELETALNHLYPGAIADWHASKNGFSATNYREYTNRQTGMYRITTRPSDDEVTEITHTCCAKQFCLKQRLWTITDKDESPPHDSKQIPCLEPCALLLEFARKAVRINQEDKTSVSLSASELNTLIASLDHRTESPVEDREAEFSNAANPRRKELLRLRLIRIQQEQSKES